jgi:hypothetical protein
MRPHPVHDLTIGCALVHPVNLWPCHPERSKGSLLSAAEMLPLRQAQGCGCAQHDACLPTCRMHHLSTLCAALVSRRRSERLHCHPPCPNVQAFPACTSVPASSSAQLWWHAAQHRAPAAPARQHPPRRCTARRGALPAPSAPQPVRRRRAGPARCARGGPRPTARRRGARAYSDRYPSVRDCQVASRSSLLANVMIPNGHQTKYAPTLL